MTYDLLLLPVLKKVNCKVLFGV